MLAVVGGKGGCGKTTSTVGVADALAERGVDPLVVDLDRDLPDLHVLLGEDRSPGLDDVAAGRSLGAVAQSSDRFPGVHMVGAGRGPVDIVPALDRLPDWRGPVLLDTPAGASEAVAAPLRAADRALLVSEATERSLADTAKTAAMARALSVPLTGAVLTRSDGHVDPEPVLGVPALAHVPSSDDPLVDRRVDEAYQRVTGEIHKRNI